MQQRIYKSALLPIFICFFVGIAYADISEVQKLRFGELVITSNDSAHSIIVNPDGSYAVSGDIIVVTAPQPGIYQIDELIPNSVITITASQRRPFSGGGNSFTMRDFQIVHTNSDASGLTNVNLGATVETSGNGRAYPSRTYNSNVRLDINY